MFKGRQGKGRQEEVEVLQSAWSGEGKRGAVAQRQLQTPARQPKAGPFRRTTPDTPAGSGDGLNQGQGGQVRRSLRAGEGYEGMP